MGRARKADLVFCTPCETCAFNAQDGIQMIATQYPPNNSERLRNR